MPYKRTQPILALLILFVATNSLAQTTINTTINSNTVWTSAGSPYLLGSSAAVAAGVTLTIQPGVVVKFTNANDEFVVNGNIVAQGTDAQPIIFTSAKDDQYGGDSNKDGAATKPSDQDWESIQIKASSGSGSIFFKCQFRYGGYYFGTSAAIEVEGSSPTISECIFFNTHKSIYVRQGGKPTINKCRFERTTKMAISVSFGSQPLMAENTFVQNGINGLGIIAGTYTGPANYTLKKIDSNTFPFASYVIDDAITLNQDVSLTIEPGVIIKFATQYENYDFIGNIKAEGTNVEPIIFTSFKDDEYGGDTNNDGTTTTPTDRDWGSIIVKTTASSFNNCQFRFGGYYFNQQAALWITANNPTIENCTFFKNDKSIYATAGAAPIIRNCVFRENTNTPVSISLSSNPIFENNNFINNKINGLGIVATTYTGPANYTLKKIKPEQFPFASYVIEDALTLNQDVNLTIEPGVIIKFASQYENYDFKGNIKAEGTTAEPIIFTSVKDDEFGGDTNNDGSTTKPTDRDWGSIILKTTASSFKNCQFRFGGYYFNQQAALWITANNPTIENCTFFKNDKSIYATSGAAPIIRNCVFRENTNTPVSISLSSNPIFENNNFINNKINGLGIVATTYTGPANYTLKKIKPEQFPFASYVIEDALTLNQDVNLTIEPGVIIKFASQYENYDFKGSIKAEGTTAEPIIFTSVKEDEFGGDTNNDGTATKPSDRDWGSIILRTSTSSFKNCQFRFGGYYFNQQAALLITASNPTIENCTFFKTDKSIYTTASAAPIIRNCVFRENTNVPVSVALSSNPVFENNNFINNKINGLGIVPGTYTDPANYTLKKIKPEQFPFASYVIEDALTLNQGVNLTIEPGVIIKFASQYEDYDFKGNIKAEGSPSDPIIFTSIKDDEYGGDTNNDGATAKPSNRDWGRIVLQNNQSSLKFCTFRYGGYYSDSDAAVKISDTRSPVIEDCQFFRVNRGITVGTNASPSISNCSFTESENAPISVYLSSKPKLSNNTFVNNGINAIGLIGGTYNTAGAYTLSKIVDANNGSNNAYYLEESMTLEQSVSLTIEPGVILKLKGENNGSRVSITLNGKLTAKGTAEEPIVFTSSRDDAIGGDTHNDGKNTQAKPGDWYSVIITSASGTGSSFEHCQIRYGGYLSGFPTNQYGAIRVLGTSTPSIKNCSFFSNAQGLVVGNGSKPNIADCTFTTSETTPISVSLGAAPIFSNIVFSRNNINAVGILPGEYTGTGNYTLEKLNLAGIDNIPYYIQQDITLSKDISLKIQAGVILKFNKPDNGSQNVRVKVDGLLTAEGTTAEPIIFTTETDDEYGGDTNNDGSLSKPGLGEWYGFITSNESKDSKFSNCIFRYGGYYNYSSEVGFGAVRSLGKSKPTVSNCTFFKNSEGVVAGGFSTPKITGNSFIDCGWTAVSMAITANPSLEDNKIDRLTIGAIGLIPTTYSDKGDFILKKRDFAGIKNSPYFVNNFITLETGFNWVIEPGIVVKVYEQENDYNNNRIIVRGSVRAEGTLGEPIVFTSANDDEFGGDIYFNGAANPAERGDWHGINLNNSTNSRFKYCKFRYGGFSTQTPEYGALLINNSAPPLIANCEFVANTRGIVVSGSSNATIDSCDFTKNRIGVYKEGGTVRVKNSNIFENVDFGVQNATTVDVDATLNWWGDPTGPLHPQKNPGGKGNKVSDYVLFEPWQQQKVSFKNDLGISAILAPNTACNFSNAETVKVSITNFGSQPQSGFEVVVMVNGVEVVRENVGTFQVLNQASADYTLRTKINLSAYRDYELKIFTSLSTEQNIFNDSKEKTIRNYRSIAPSAQFSSLQPANNEPEVEATQPFFSWSPIEHAASYDLYVWLAIGIEPSVPTVANLSELSYQFSQALVYGAQYRWKVVARNPCSSVSSPIQTFKVKSLPDLMVKQIKVPNAPFSGQLAEISWETINQGTSSTGDIRWYDAVYLSQDSVLDTQDDYYLGAVYNDIALNPGEGYTQMGQFTLPKEVENGYYVFVIADNFNYVREFNDNNNTRFTGIDIKLTPPPDLTVSSVIAPFNAFSEQFIPISYTVSNIGQGPTVEGVWRDRVYLSPDPELVLNRAIVLGSYPHSSNLQPGQTYTRKENIALPKGVSGLHFIHVTTDLDNQVFEYAYENNNSGRSDTMDITLTPPPDLQVTSLQAPLSVSNGERVAIRWTVNNLGASRAKGSWGDEVYISKSPVFNNQAIYIGSQYQYNRDLLPNSSYSVTSEVAIPSNINGAYYFFVMTDVNNNIFEYNKEDNNTRRSDQSVMVLSPDLAVQNLSAPGSAISGQAINVSWSVQNAGPGALANVQRRDLIYLSPSSSFEVNKSIRLDSIEYGGALEVAQNTRRQKSITLPNGISGRYYVVVFTDANNKVFENGNESNNSALTLVDISLAPWPDLQVSKIEGVPSNMIAGNAVQLTYTVQNRGEGNISNRVWKDRLYLSASSIWMPELAKPLQDVDVVQSLSPQASYLRTINFNLPMLPGAAMTGVCYLYIFADATNAIYEHTDEGNNTLRSIPINVSAPPPVDLNLLSVQADVNDTLQSGQRVNLRWTVNNIGSSTEVWDYYYWYDGVYLSKDQKWDPGDRFITDWTEQGPLEEQEDYEDRQWFVLPPGISGDYYLLLVSDHKGLVRDGNMLNNVRSLREGKAIHFKKRNYSDLAITDYQTSLNAVAGQPLALNWTIKNEGEGGTLGSSWTDKAYLSQDARLDNLDPIVASVNRDGALNPGETYTVNAEASIPISAKGNYLLWLKTDANNAEYEVPSEQNNLVSYAINVVVPPPADLQVGAITHPDSVFVGNELTVEWTTINKGTNPANGRRQDFVYLSKDNQWDLNDRVLGSKIINGNLPPGGQDKQSMSMMVPGLESGIYHIIVQTDGLNNIIERNDTNNIGVSSKTIKIGVKILPINVLTADQLSNEQNLYYKIEVVDSLAGETLLISLQGDSLNGVNELYLSHQSTPTRSDHEYASSDPFKSKQTIVVPNLQAGTYYLLAYGNNRQGAAQKISLLARIVPFEIRSVQAKQGGNTGTVTVKVEGGKFEEVMSWSLKLASGPVVNAQQVYFINSTQAFVSFNLSGAAVGHYDVQALKANGAIAMLAKGFEVVEGSSLGNGVGAANNGFVCSIENTDTEELISTAALHPPSTRPNRIVAIRIVYANIGNVDVPTPVRFLFSLEKAPLAFEINELNKNLQELYLEFKDKDGPPGILRPGSSGSILVYTKAIAPLQFFLTE